MIIRVRDGQPNEIIYEERDQVAGQEDLSEKAVRVWTGFFLEARRLAALARERRAAREAAQEQGDRPSA